MALRNVFKSLTIVCIVSVSFYLLNTMWLISSQRNIIRSGPKCAYSNSLMPLPTCVQEALDSDDPSHHALEQCHGVDLIEAILQMNSMVKQHQEKSIDDELKRETDGKKEGIQDKVNSTDENLKTEFNGNKGSTHDRIKNMDDELMKKIDGKHSSSTVSPTAVVNKTCVAYHGLNSGEPDGEAFIHPNDISACGGSPVLLVSKHQEETARKNTKKKEDISKPISAQQQPNLRNISNGWLPPSPQRVVPNVVHYVYFGDSFELNFLNYLSLLSVHKFIKPDYIYIHGDVAPSGVWWDKAIATIPNIYRVQREMPQLIFGIKPIHKEHCADLARLQILLDFGGIYLDWDVLALRSFAPLLQYEMTLGRVRHDILSNGIIIARRGAAFIRVWLETYHDFHQNEWGYNSVLMTARLATLLPHLLHIEEKSLLHPTWQNLGLMFSGHYPWRENNYSMHIWARLRKVPTNSTEIKALNCTLGEVMRHVLYT